MELPEGLTEERFLEAYHFVIDKIAHKYVFTSFECNDIRQEAFLIAYDGLKSYDKGRSLENFLYIHLSNRLKNFKRDNYYRAFDDFDPHKIAAYGEEKIASLLADPGIVRNRAKVGAFVHNAQVYLDLQTELGSFSDFLWGFVGGKPIVNTWQTLSQLPAVSPESETMSKALKQRGFSFVGPTICYAFMQAVGMVNDHTVDCFRYLEVQD